MDWQPIETAPRDGTPIIAYNEVFGAYNTCYTKRWDTDTDEGYRGFPCGFNPRAGGYYPFGKWDCAPTHWQPAPNPPTNIDRSPEAMRRRNAYRQGEDL